jgi:hypothetical protein
MGLNQLISAQSAFDFNKMVQLFGQVVANELLVQYINCHCNLIRLIEYLDQPQQKIIESWIQSQ